MPVILQRPIQLIEQDEFSDIAYHVMATVFEVHHDLGRLFDEIVYQIEITARLEQAQREVPIEVTFHSFRKVYYIDLVVNNCAIFELKTVDAIVPRHRSQLLHYLLLAGVRHGKLINLRPEKVQHEFVNTALSNSDRVRFSINDQTWDDCRSPGMKDWFVAFTREFGVGLDLSIYEEASAYHSGPIGSLARIEITNDSGRPIGSQEVQLATPGTAIQFTAYAQSISNHTKTT